MKFGRNLPRNQVPEWDTAYIKYKPLKKIIKSVATASNTPTNTTFSEGLPSVDTAHFFHYLDRNLEDVDRFYNRKFGDAARRLKLLQDRYGRSLDTVNTMDKEEAEDLMGALLELRDTLRKLQWYGEVNRRGFVKITKKMDKKVDQEAQVQKRYVESKVDTRQFATNADLNDTLKTVNDWLSRMSELKIQDDTSSTHSGHSLHRMASSALLRVPHELLDAFEQAVRTDDAVTLVHNLSKSRQYQDVSSREDIIATLSAKYLQRAISARAKLCLREILSRITSLNDPDEINRRNCLHRFIISLGRSQPTSDAVSNPKVEGDEKVEARSNGGNTDVLLNGINYLKPATAPVLGSTARSRTETDAGLDLEKDGSSIALFEYLLDSLSPSQQQDLTALDTYRRTPLHYAAQYGLVPICYSLIQRMKQGNLFIAEDGRQATFWCDVDGCSPLHFGVMGGHPQCTRILLEAAQARSDENSSNSNKGQLFKGGEILRIAVKANFVRIVQLLIAANADVDYQDDQGETALHEAARFGHSESADILLQGQFGRKADTEKTEVNFGWTALHVASVDGHLAVVKSLIVADAVLDRVDSSGWTALEHAALRGHIDVASAIGDACIVPFAEDSQRQQVNSKATNGQSTSTKSLSDRRSSNTQTGTGNSQNTMRSSPEPVKSFGHRYLQSESMVLVSLGTMDTRKAVEAVNLDRIPLADVHSTQLDTALSIVISASGASGEPSIVDLPIEDNIYTEPVAFMTKDASKVKLLFDVVPTYAGSTDRIIGRGVALLSSIKPSIGSKRISLQGDVTVPIVAVQTMDVIGSVNFNFLIITPFSHPNMTISTESTYWKSLASTMVIGHRGLGKNSTDRSSLQLGENTLQSFIAAANLGASYVEFDVQLTKDHVPVIYHDFLVSETGIDAPVHTLTLEQFLHISDGRSNKARNFDTSTKEEGSHKEPTENSTNRQPINGTGGRKVRSMSASEIPNSSDLSALERRMKHTRDFKEKGFKGNSRGSSIQAPFTTLEEMFRKLPTSIGFNIEMKYPMLFESEEQGMDTYAVELNSFVDTVLTKVYDFTAPPGSQEASSTEATGTAHRNIIFSSFNPDICLLLSFKQPSIPILFLTDAGASPTGDIRASSLQEAIRFASRWNLLGVVSAAEPLILAPRLVKVVKESGLVCVSYGTLNNDPRNVRKQVKEGIDAVIVDSVLAIRKGLTEEHAVDVSEENIPRNGNAPQQSASSLPSVVAAKTAA